MACSRQCHEPTAVKRNQMMGPGGVRRGEMARPVLQPFPSVGMSADSHTYTLAPTDAQSHPWCAFQQWCVHALLTIPPSLNPVICTQLSIPMFHFSNRAYAHCYRQDNRLCEWASTATLAEPVPSCLFFFAVTECKEYGGCRRFHMSLHLLWVFQCIPFINTLFQIQGTGCFVYITTAFCWGSKHHNTSLPRRLLRRRSVFPNSILHELWATAELEEFLEEDTASSGANFKSPT